MLEALHTIAHRLTGVVRKRPGVTVCLCGEAGIGKSHTALGLLRATPCRHATVRATIQPGELVRTLPTPDHLATWTERTLESIGSGATVTGTSLVEAIASVLAGLAPFVLVVEDLHEANPETLELWLGLAAAVQRSKGVGLILTTRGAAPSGLEAVTLPAKTFEETTEIIRNELGGNPPAEAARWIHTRTAGNPLYALEHARFLARRGFLWSDGRRWRWRTPPDDLVPNTVEALIEHELRTVTLDTTVKNALEAFSVLEAKTRVDNALWARVAGLTEPDLERARAVLEGVGIIAGGTFRHPLYREVTAHTLGSFRQRELEERAFVAFEPDDPVAATQFLEHIRVDETLALKVIERAETMARKRKDGVLTARMQALAIRYAQSQERGRLALEAARGLRRVSLTEAVPLAEMAVRERPDDPEAVYLLAELLTTQGRLRDVERVLERLPSHERQGTGWPERLLKLRAGLRDFSGVLELWHAHPALRDQTDPEVACHVGWALLHTNDTRTASELVERIEQEGLEPERLADIKQVQAAIHFYAGNAERAAQDHQESITVFRRVGASEKLLYALRNRANALMLLGQYAEAKNNLEAALEAANQRGDAGEVCKTQVLLGSLLTDLGEFEAAEDALSEALETLGRMDPGLMRYQCHETLFWLYRAWQPPLGRVLMVKHAEDALSVAQTLGHERLVLQGQAILGDARAQNREVANAWPLLNAALEKAHELDEPERICIIEGLRGAVFELEGNLAEAASTYRTSEELAQENGLMVEEHRAGLERSRLLGDTSAFREHVAWFAERGLWVPLKDQPTAALEPAPIEPTIEPSNMRLNVLGPMQLIRDGEPVPVRGGKRQELLVLLLEARIAGQAETNRLELLDLLYPEDDEERATGNLKTLVHSTRETLGTEVIVTTPNGYALGGIGSDVESFLADLETRWWRGAYLEGLEAHDENAREAVHAALLTATRKVLPSDPSEAVRTSRLLVKADPYNLDALEVHLRALHATGNRKSLGRAFEEAKERLAEVGETLPETHSMFLASRELVPNS